MGIWQRLTGSEKRQDGGSYSDAVIALIQAQSGGASAAVGATAAVEAVSGYISRAFASADVTVADSRMEGVLDPHTLSMIGRSLIRHGEFVGVIKVDQQRGTLRLAPAASWSILGNEDPKSWTYLISLSGPSRQGTIENIPSTGVVHIMFASDPSAPHRGIGPLQAAHLAGRLSAEVSTALADELSGPRGALLPLPNLDGTDPTIDSLKSDIRGLSGGLAFVESQADSFGSGPTTNPSPGWQSRRLGAEIPSGSIESARLAFSEIVAACGLSTSLWFDADGASKRESYRQSLHATLAPLGRLVSSQLTEKFETDVQLEWGELKAGDIASSARAFRTMVEAGLSLSEAAALSGLMVAE